jgi:hypothetical protein
MKDYKMSGMYSVKEMRSMYKVLNEKFEEKILINRPRRR